MTRDDLRENIKRTYRRDKSDFFLYSTYREDAMALGMDREDADIFIFRAQMEVDAERPTADSLADSVKEPYWHEAARLSAEGKLSDAFTGLESRVEDELGVWRQDASDIIHEGVRRYEFMYLMKDADFSRREKSARRIVESAWNLGELKLSTYRQRTVDYVMRELGVDVHRASAYIALVVQQLQNQPGRVAV